MPDHPKTLARRAALRALVASEREEFSPENFSSVDTAVRPFAREIYSGTLRYRARLDWTLAPLLKKPLEKLDPPVRAALRLALYEKLALQTPDRALANEYTELMRGAKLKSATGFINAITRRLPAEWREAVGNEAQRLSIELSHPRWLIKRYLERLGPDETTALLEANNQVAPSCLRVNTLKSSREKLLSEIPGSTPGELSPDAIYLERGDVTGLDQWKNGQLFAQDEAAQLVALLAAPKSGDFVIDCAAAPGGKTTHLAQIMGNRGRILALDSSPLRLLKVKENAARLDISIVEARAGDLRVVGPELAQWGSFADVVTLDAPCLGTGTLRRRPDAKWRKTPEQLQQLLQLQSELIDCAALLVKPGGVLVYSTCSLEREENEGQIEAFLARRDDFSVERAPSTFGAAATSDGFLNTWPHRHGCDGMFAARLKRGS
jgi:16S rRNA (cytosine967-C5)-methyltransferase